MAVIVEAKALANFSVWLKFADGTEGTVDLSALAGKGVFSHWLQGDNFSRLSIGSSGELRWGDAVDLCPDSLYLRVTGKRPEDLFPSLRGEPTHA
jgi:hypothetical protein